MKAAFAASRAHNASWALILAAPLAAFCVGVVAARSPLFTLIFVGCSLLVLIAVLGSATEGIFLFSLGSILIGYMVESRGFAYLGIQPIYIGDLVLAFGIAIVPFVRMRWRFSAIHLLLMAFMGLGAMLTLRSIPEYGLDAIRDAAIWYYAAFAFLLSFLMTEQRFRAAIRIAGAMVPILTLWLLVMSLFFRFLPGTLPHLPGSPVPILYVMKPGDRAVILSALAGLVSTGLYNQERRKLVMPTTWFWIGWLICASIVAISNRGGMLAMAASMSLVALTIPSKEWLRVATIGAVAIAFLVVADPTIDIGRNRDLSLDQLQANITSIFSNEGGTGGQVQATKEWRLLWWKDIYNDTVHGRFFWQGQGFGINLADYYGFQTDLENHSLRSPHNIHMTVLARMGVPGLFFWTMVHTTFFVQMVRTYLNARAQSQRYWASVSVWLLTVWLAALVNATFDVYLEGPYGAIPFWCSVGAGIVAMRLQRESATDMSGAMSTLESQPARPEIVTTIKPGLTAPRVQESKEVCT